MILTTSRRPHAKSRRLCKELESVIPLSQYILRGKKGMRELISLSVEKGADRLVIVTSQENTGSLLFYSGWNLSNLSLTGWGEFPSFLTKPRKTAFGQLKLDFQSTSIRLRPSDPLYLERIQPCSPRELRAEFGVSAQQRLRDLSQHGAIQASPSFRSIQCGAMVFLYCRGASTVLKAIAKQVKANESEAP